MKNILFALFIGLLSACSQAPQEVVVSSTGGSTAQQSDDTVLEVIKHHAKADFFMPDSTEFPEPVQAVLIISLLDMPLEGYVNLGLLPAHRLSEVVMATKEISAVLVSDDFDIVLETPHTQPLMSNDATEWQWSLTPTSWGELSVRLIINGVYGSDKEFTLDRFERVITVDISFKQYVWYYLTEYLNVIKWIVGGLFIPLLAWLWKLYRNKE